MNLHKFNIFLIAYLITLTNQVLYHRKYFWMEIVSHKKDYKYFEYDNKNL
jgi:hypothetical protein